MSRQSRLLLVAASTTGAIGIGIFILAPYNSIGRTVSMLLVVVSAYLFTAYRKSASEYGLGYDIPTSITTAKSPGLAAWLLSALAFLAVLISYWLVRIDAANGGHQGWPAYAFAGSALFAAVIWGYVFTRLVNRGG